MDKYVQKAANKYGDGCASEISRLNSVIARKTQEYSDLLTRNRVLHERLSELSDALYRIGKIVDGDKVF